MNIFALPGHKVIVTERSKNAGYDSDKKRVAEQLEVGKEYTIDHTEVHRSYTDVFLVEVPADGRRPIGFNSVNFEDVVEQSDEASKQHPDWERFRGNGRGRYF